MFCCDKCKCESVKVGHSKPCGYNAFIYEDEGGICEICGEKADVFLRTEMIGFKSEQQKTN